MKQEQAFGALWVYGQDATTFLDGQLSINVASLREQWRVAAYCTPQGKVIAVVWIADFSHHGTQGYLLFMPKALLEPVSQRLQKYVLRSKVKLEPLAMSAKIEKDTSYHHSAQAQTLPLQLCTTLLDNSQPNHIILHGWYDFSLRIEIDLPADNTPWAELSAQMIQHGIPIIHTANSEQFVPQMLGLLPIGGIDLHKGCYVGQEVVARLHYKSSVRKLLTWTYVTDPLRADIMPGMDLFDAQRKVGTILTAVAYDDGALVQAVIHDTFVDKPLRFSQTQEQSLIFTSARTSSQGI